VLRLSGSLKSAEGSFMDYTPSVLFLCTQNAARSQMAEGWMRHLAGDRFAVYSAGIEPAGVHPLAIEVMGEVGIDISGQKSKSVRAYLGTLTVTHLIVVCAQAEAKCPRLMPGMLHRELWPFEDPAAVDGDEQAQRQAFRAVRDQIRQKIESWLADDQAPEQAPARRRDVPAS
jgi:arsenate reductase